MRRQVVSIYIWKGKAYLPLQGRFDSGIWTDLDPVYVSNLNEGEIVDAINKVLAAGHPRLPDPSKEEWQRRKDPVLAATKASSWKALAREGASYSLGWTHDQIRVDVSMLDKKGRWQFNPEKVRIFPIDANLQLVVAPILEDIRARPELEQTQ